MPKISKSVQTSGAPQRSKPHRWRETTDSSWDAAAYLSQSENTIRCIEKFLWETKSLWNFPACQSLYVEMNDYLLDLLVQGWIKQSHSMYGSLAVCVRKNMAGKSLSIDYRELNHKTLPVRQPIPRVQDVMPWRLYLVCQFIDSIM